MTGRLERLRALLEREGLDGLLISAPGEEGPGWESRAYLSGFTGSAGVLLVTRSAAVLAVDSRYWEQAEQETTGRGVRVLRAQGPRQGWLRELVGEAGAAGKRIGVSPRDLTFAAFLGLTEMLEALPAEDRPELVPAFGLVEELRRVKDREELALLEAARGMGMDARQILWRIEVPLALPVVVAGVRTAAVDVFASATLAAFIGGGGLGDFIARGFALFDPAVMLVGAVPVAVLTLGVEAVLAGTQRVLEHLVRAA